ncbi:cubilin-like [Ixodes scapularis]
MYDFEGNEKVIRFHSDAANSRPGFQIQMRQHECALQGQSPRPPPARPLQGLGPVDEGHRQPPPQQQKCDKIFTSRLFDIRSLGYPRGYPNDLDCKYIVFQVSHDICSLELTFLDFDIEKNQECSADFLELDGERVCGSLPPDSKKLVQFTSAQMVFRFRTDHSSNRPGFHIKARQVQCGSRVPPVTNLGKAPALGVPCTYEFCDRSGVFYSQGFPGPYPNQMSCTYRVLALPGHCRVELSFVQFNLESHKKPDGQCGADFMEINNVRYCNRQLEGQISKAPALGVPCTYEFCDRSGVFYSQGFPGPYPNQMSCTYRVLALPGHCRVELSFVQFNLESHKKPDGQCGADFMEINNVRYCNRQLEGQIRILDFKDSPRSITMHFITNDHNAGRGFLGFYKQLACEGHNRVPDRPVPAEPPSLFEPGFEPPRQPPDTQRQPSCDRLYALREFELESPGYPSSYPPGLDCRYFIRRLNDGICALRVTFNSFDLEDSPSCHNDYFEVDGHKICGQLPPGKAKEVPLRDFQTTFRFHSNGAVEHRGFLVQVVQVPCQGPPSFDAQPSPPGRYPHHSAMGPASHSHQQPHPVPPSFGPGASPYHPSLSGPSGTVGPGPRPGIGHGGPPLPPVPQGPETGGDQCDRVLAEPYFELRSTALGSGSVDCRIIVRRHGPDMCRLELLFIRFDVDCNQDQFRVQDVQICGRLDHYSTRSYEFDGPEMYIYYHSSSDGKASDFLIKGRQTTCTGALPPPPPPPHSPGPPPAHGHGHEYPRHHGGVPQGGYPPPPPPPHYPPPPPPAHSILGPRPSHYPGPPSHYPPPSPHYPPPSQLYPPPSQQYPPPAPHYPPPPAHPPPAGGARGYPGQHGLPDPRIPPPPAPHHGHPPGPWPQQPSPPSGRPEWTPPGGGPPAPGPRMSDGALPVDNCDRTFMELEFTVNSPNFPGPYPGRTICRYMVRRFDSATCAIEVLFTKFDMESNPDCQYEHLEVDGRKLCGTLPENTVQKFPFFQPETEKVLVFRSDRGSPRPGFSIRVRQVTDCAGGTSWMPGKDKPPPPPNPLCDYCQREQRGQLSSPNYPQPYGPNTRCTYRIEPVPGHCQVEVYFHDFDVESSPGCQKDFLELDKTQRNCGNDLNKAILVASGFSVTVLHFLIMQLAAVIAPLLLPGTNIGLMAKPVAFKAHDGAWEVLFHA